jgi:hypothetical protein
VPAFAHGDAMAAASVLCSLICKRRRRCTKAEQGCRALRQQYFAGNLSIRRDPSYLIETNDKY